MSGARRHNRRLVLLFDALVTALVSTSVALAGPWFRTPEVTPGAVVIFSAACTVTLVGVLKVRPAHRRAYEHVSPSLVAFAAASATSWILVLAADGLFPRVRSALPPAASLLVFAICALGLPAVNHLVLSSSAGGLLRITRVLILGTGPMADEVAGRLGATALVEVVGFVDDASDDGHRVLGRLEQLPSLCRLEGIDRVVVAFSEAHPERIAQILRRLDPEVAVDIVPRFFELTGFESHLHDLHGLTVVTVGAPARTARPTITVPRSASEAAVLSSKAAHPSTSVASAPRISI